MKYFKITIALMLLISCQKNHETNILIPNELLASINSTNSSQWNWATEQKVVPANYKDAVISRVQSMSDKDKFLMTYKQGIKQTQTIITVKSTFNSTNKRYTETATVGNESFTFLIDKDGRVGYLEVTGTLFKCVKSAWVGCTGSWTCKATCFSTGLWGLSGCGQATLYRCLFR